MSNKGALLLFFLGIFTFVNLAQGLDPEERQVVKREASPLADPTKNNKNPNENKPNKGNGKKGSNGKSKQKGRKGKSNKNLGKRSRKVTKQTGNKSSRRARRRKQKSQRNQNKKDGGKKSDRRSQNKNPANQNKKSARNKNERQITGIATTCIINLALYAKLNDKKATSIIKQVKNVYSKENISMKKSGKKGDFNSTKNLLLTALGGNASAPTCDGNAFPAPTSRAGRAMRSANDSLKTLQSCEEDIGRECGFFVTSNATLKMEIDNCTGYAGAFKTAFIKCVEMKDNADGICKCIEGIDDANIAKMQKCNTQAASIAALANKKKCITGFGKCKQAEDDSVEGIDTCKPKNKCGGAKDKEEAEKILKVLAPLSDALKNPAMENAMKTAGLDKGSGDDGQIPSGRYFRELRGKRQAIAADGDGCKDLDSEWGKFNSSATKTGTSVSGEVDEDAANNTTAILNGINGRKTLAADLGSCAKETRVGTGGRQTIVSISITVIRIRIYIFWCVWWRVTIIEVKIVIIYASFPVTTPTPALTSTASQAATTTKAAPARRILRDIIKRAAIPGFN